MRNIFLFAALMVAAKSIPNTTNYTDTSCTNSNECNAGFNCENKDHYGGGGQCEPVCANDLDCDVRYMNSYYKCDSVNNMCVYRECNNQTDCTNMYGQDYICDTTVDWYYQCTYNGPAMCYNTTECNSGENCEGKDHYGGGGKCQPECNNDLDCDARYMNSNYKCDANMGNMCVYKECNNDNDCGMIDYKCDKSVDWYYQCFYDPTYCTNSSQCTAPQNCEGLNMNGNSGTCQQPCLNDTTCAQRYNYYYKCDVTMGNMCVYRECYNDTYCTNMYDQYHACNTTVDWYYFCQYNGPTMCYNVTECNSGENCEGKDHYGSNGKCQPECNNDQDCSDRYNNDSNYKCDVSMGNMCVYKQCDNDIDCTTNYGIDWKCDTSVNWYYQCSYSPTYCTDSSDCVIVNTNWVCDTNYGSPYGFAGECMVGCSNNTFCEINYGYQWLCNVNGLCEEFIPSCTNDTFCQNFYHDSYQACDLTTNECVYTDWCTDDEFCTNMYDNMHICIIDTGECKYVDFNMTNTTTTENPTNTKDMTTTKDITNTADMTTSTGMATATSKEGSTTEAMTTNATKEMSTTEEIVDVCVDDVKKNRCHGNAGECDKDKRHGYSKYNQIVDVDEWCVWCLCEDYWRCAYYALPAITQLVDDNDMWESVKGDFAQDAKNWFMETCFGHLGASECSFAKVELKDPVTGCKCDTFTCNGYDGKTETVDTDNNSDGGKYGVFGTMVVAFGMVLWI